MKKYWIWGLIGVLVVAGLTLTYLGRRGTAATVLPAGVTLEQARAMEEDAKVKMPEKYKMWRESAHGVAGVTCVNCHGTEPITGDKLTYQAFAGVKPETCGACHQKELEGFQQTRHYEAVKYSMNNLRGKLLDAYPAMKTQGCDSCHYKVGTTCTSCHNVHDSYPTSAKPGQVQANGLPAPQDLTNGCENCHMGPDHPQREAYESSEHRKVAERTGAPTCITCHTDDNNVHLIYRIKGTPDNGRAVMETKCEKCHSEEYTKNMLANVDQIKAETAKIVNAGRTIIKDLYKDGILKPSPGVLLDKDGMPRLDATGTSYSHVSHIENTMFELFKYAEATTVRGAQHFSPDYAHWHGNAQLWEKYLAIKDEAERMRFEYALSKKMGVPLIELPMYKYSQETGHELDSLKNPAPAAPATPAPAGPAAAPTSTP